MVGAGKAAATMAKAVEDNWDGPFEGLVVTRYGHAVPCERIKVVEASHPVPDAAGEAAACRMLDMLGDLTEDDLVLALISDVPGDDPSVIASGPTVPDPSTFADALDILEAYGIDQPSAVIDHLRRGEEETPKPGDPRLDGNELKLIATPEQSLEAAKTVAEEAGINALILGDAIEGEARQVAKVMSGIAQGAALHGQPIEPPVVLISGGETTVTARGSGRGGRNVEFLLALALELENVPGIYAIAGDTDGVDGAKEIAGALITPDSLTRASDLDISAKAMLADTDGHSFFEALGDQVITGPTLTNIDDFRAIMITGRQG